MDPSSLPDVEFAVKDPAVIVDEAVADFEAEFLRITGIPKTLGPADPTRIVIQNSCQLVSHLRSLVDTSAKENLLKYSHDAFLDNIAGLYGELVLRLPASPATTTLRFELSAGLAFAAVIPQGTQCSGAEQLIFETLETVFIPPGELVAEASAACTTAGVVGNGYTPGQINAVVNWGQPWAFSVANTVTTAGGADIESDESLRYRTYLAPESQNTCGCREGYEFWARSASPDIIDVAVVSFPIIAGEVHLTPLMTNGRLPTQAEMDAVYIACDEDTRRPVADFVSVFSPVQVPYDLDVGYVIYEGNEISFPDIEAQVLAAVDEWMFWTKTKLGRDISPSQLAKRLMLPGVKRIEIVAPAYVALEPNQQGVLRPLTVPLIRFIGFEPE